MTAPPFNDQGKGKSQSTEHESSEQAAENYSKFDSSMNRKLLSVDNLKAPVDIHGGFFHQVGQLNFFSV